MMRLGLLMAVTLAGLFAVLTVWGGDDLRATRMPQAPAPAPVSAALDAGAQPLTAPAAGSLPSQPDVEIVPAASQTPERRQRFPGPALEPSPEYGGAPTPDPSAAGIATPPGDVPDLPRLFVTGDRVNMRAGAGTDAPVVASLTRGSAVGAMGPTGGDWVQIRTAQGQEGFIAAPFLSPEAP